MKKRHTEAMRTPLVKLATAIMPCRRVSSIFFLWAISLFVYGVLKVFLLAGSLLDAITNQESESKRFAAGIPETHHAAVHREYLVLNVAFAHTVAVLVELIATASYWNVSSDIFRHLLEGRFPREVPLSIGAAGELQVHEHPVVKDDHEGIAGESEVIPVRSHSQALLGSLDGICALVKLGIHRDEVEQERSVVVEPRLLLDDNCILVFDPGLEDGTAIIDGITPGIVLRLDKAHEYAADGTAVNRQIRNGDFQLLAGLVCGIGGVKLHLCIQNHVIGGLIILEGYLARAEVIGYAVEHGCSGWGLVDDTGSEDLSMRVVRATTMGESQLRLAIAVIHIHQVGLGIDMTIRIIGTAKAHSRTDNLGRKLLVQKNLGRSDIAMAKALGVELRYRSTGRKVHVQRGHVAFLSRIKTVHRSLYSALVR